MVIKAIFHVFFLKFEKKVRTLNMKQYSSKNEKERFEPSIPSPPQNKTKQNKKYNEFLATTKAIPYFVFKSCNASI